MADSSAGSVPMGHAVLPLSKNEVARLKEALEECDADTKAFIKPLLGYQPVQNMLLSFLNDESKSLQEWIWEANAQRVLKRLRLQIMENGDAGSGRMAFMNDQYEKQITEISEKNQDTIADAILRAKKLKEEGTEKFKKNYYYAAKRAYEKAAEDLQTFLDAPYPEAAETEDRDTSEDDLYEEALGLVVTCFCNAAVASLKEDDSPSARESANKALYYNGNSVKGLYLYAKACYKLFYYDEAAECIQQLLDIEPENKDARMLEKILKAKMAEKPKQIKPLILETEEPKPVVAKEYPKPKHLPSLGLHHLPLITRFLEWSFKSDREADFTFEEVESQKYICVATLDGVELARSTLHPKKRLAKKEACELLVQKLYELHPDQIPPEEESDLTPQDVALLRQIELNEEKARNEWEKHDKWDKIKRAKKNDSELLHNICTKLLLQLDVEGHSVDESSYELTITVDDEITATVVAPKKKEAKALAATEILPKVEAMVDERIKELKQRLRWDERSEEEKAGMVGYRKKDCKEDCPASNGEANPVSKPESNDTKETKVVSSCNGDTNHTQEVANDNMEEKRCLDSSAANVTQNPEKDQDEAGKRAEEQRNGKDSESEVFVKVEAEG